MLSGVVSGKINTTPTVTDSNAAHHAENRKMRAALTDVIALESISDNSPLPAPSSLLWLAGPNWGQTTQGYWPHNFAIPIPAAPDNAIVGFIRLLFYRFA